MFLNTTLPAINFGFCCALCFIPAGLGKRELNQGLSENILQFELVIKLRTLIAELPQNLHLPGRPVRALAWCLLALATADFKPKKTNPCKMTWGRPLKL